MKLTADQALERLKQGNLQYMTARTNPGDISPALRLQTAEHGQEPYAAVLCCSDSREVPEHIFSAGLGELFVIRVAGNVVDNHQLGSIEYAADHLGCRLILVMGHDGCGAVDAAMHHAPGGYIRFLTDEICRAIGTETDYDRACRLNVAHSAERIRREIDPALLDGTGLQIAGALYHLADGSVEFLS